MDNMKNDLEKLMKAASEMQESMQKAQEELNDLTVTGKAGTGEKVVTVTMNGRHDLRRVKIEPSLLTEPIDFLEDLVAAAVNDAIRKVEKVSRDKVNDLAKSFTLSKDLLNDDKAKDED